MRRPPHPRGFSLLELLVVIAIIAMLLGMLVPGLKKARQHAYRTLCATRLREWGVALQLYRHDFNDYIPTEGHHGLGIPDQPWTMGHNKNGTWYNELPPYLSAPRYKDVEGVNLSIKAFPDAHVWICPAKNRSANAVSETGKNQFHFAMNRVLDGVGPQPYGGPTTPGFPDLTELPLKAAKFAHKPTTVFMFDVEENYPSEDPYGIATRFHVDHANVLYLGGEVAGFHRRDFLTDSGAGYELAVWRHPHLYWGYLPPQ